MYGSSSSSDLFVDGGDGLGAALDGADCFVGGLDDVETASVVVAVVVVVVFCGD